VPKKSRRSEAIHPFMNGRHHKIVNEFLDFIFYDIFALFFDERACFSSLSLMSYKKLVFHQSPRR
jgi:hypothetical protein